MVYGQSQPHLHLVPLECETGNSEHPHLAHRFHLVPVPNVPLRKSSSSGDSCTGSNRREAYCSEGFFSEQKPEDAYVDHVQICVQRLRCRAKKDTENKTLLFRKITFNVSSHAHSCMEPTASNLCSCIWLLAVFPPPYFMNNHCTCRLKNLLL